MSETPRLKGGSRGLANMIRQHSASPTVISGFASFDSNDSNNLTPRSVNLPSTNSNARNTVDVRARSQSGEASPFSATKVVSPPSLSFTKPPPPKKFNGTDNDPNTPSTGLPSVKSPKARDDSVLITSSSPPKSPSKKSPIKSPMKTSTMTSTPPIPTKPLSPKPSSSTAEYFSTPNGINKLEELSLSEKLSPKGNFSSSLSSNNEKSLSPPVTLTPSNGSGRKGNISIGAKAGGVYTEASYAGDGDEVDESEW